MGFVYSSGIKQFSFLFPSCIIIINLAYAVVKVIAIVHGYTILRTPRPTRCKNQQHPCYWTKSNATRKQHSTNVHWGSILCYYTSLNASIEHMPAVPLAYKGHNTDTDKDIYGFSTQLSSFYSDLEPDLASKRISTSGSTSRFPTSLFNQGDLTKTPLHAFREY